MQRSAFHDRRGPGSLHSGLWHQTQERGQPLKNTTERIPGPSSRLFLLIWAMRGLLVSIRSAARRPQGACAAAGLPGANDPRGAHSFPREPLEGGFEGKENRNQTVGCIRRAPHGPTLGPGHRDGHTPGESSARITRGPPLQGGDLSCVSVPAVRQGVCGRGERI